MASKTRLRPGAALLAAAGLGMVVNATSVRAQAIDLYADPQNPTNEGYTAELRAYNDQQLSSRPVIVHNLPNATIGALTAPISVFGEEETKGINVTISSAVTNPQGQMVALAKCWLIQPTIVQCDMTGYQQMPYPDRPAQMSTTTQYFGQAQMDGLAQAPNFPQFRQLPGYGS